MNEPELQNKLSKFVCPFFIVINGPAREHRTRFRAEHGNYFNYSKCYSIKEALNLIKAAYDRYPGHYEEMDIIVIHLELNEDGIHEMVTITI